MNNIIFSTVILLAYLVKLFISPVSFQDCAVVALLSSVYGFVNYLQYNKEKNVSNEYKDKIHLEVATLKAELDLVKSKIGALSIASSSRLGMNGR